MMNILKKSLKSTYLEIASRRPVINILRRAIRANVIVLMYHEVAEDSNSLDAWTVVRKSDFVRQMEYLTEYYNVIPISEAVARMGSDKPSTNEQPAAVITFDDGYSGNRNVVLPIISSMNIPVTVFVATRAVQEGILYWYDRIICALEGMDVGILDLAEYSLGVYPVNMTKGATNWMERGRLLEDLKKLSPELREKVVEAILNKLEIDNSRPCGLSFMTISELREMAQAPLVTIGAHSHCHNLLDQLTPEKVSDSVGKSKASLESWIGRPVEYLAYPNGNYNDMVIEAIRGTGFSHAFTTVAKPWGRNESNFTLPRIGIGRYDSMKLFKTKLAGGLSIKRMIACIK